MLGTSQVIDENGDAGGYYTLIALMESPLSGNSSAKMDQVANFESRECGPEVPVCLPVSLEITTYL
jgi:hypothetical protein